MSKHLLQNRPRVAVCFYGNLRTFRRCLGALRKNLLDLYDCDIFMHTWDRYDHNSKTWHGFRCGADKIVDPDKIKRLLGVSDEQIIVDTTPFDDNKSLYYYEGNTFSSFGLGCMYTSMRAVNKLRDEYARTHGIKYDAVVFIRPDVFLNTKFNLIDTITNENALYFVGNLIGQIDDIKQIRASDIFFWARPDVIDSVMEKMTFDIHDGATLPILPEGLFVANIISAGATPICCADYKYGSDFYILRPRRRFRVSRDIITLHTRRDGIFVGLLMFMGGVIDINIKFFNRFAVHFSIGNSNNKEY